MALIASQLSASALLSLAEHLMIAIVPAGTSLLAMPLVTDRRFPSRHDFSPYAAAKALLPIGGALVVAQAASFFMGCASGIFSAPSVPLIAALLSMIASFAVVFLLHTGHAFISRPPATPALFLGFTLLYDAAFTLHLYSKLSSVAHLQAVILVLKCVVVGIAYQLMGLYISANLSTYERCKIDAERRRKEYLWPYSPFHAVTRLPRHFLASDLPDPSSKLPSSELYEQFLRQWKQIDKSSKHALLRAILRTFRTRFLLTAPTRLLYILFSLSRPLLFQYITEKTFGGENSFASSLTNGLLVTSVFFGTTLFNHVSRSTSARTKEAVRSIMVAAVYDKSLRIKTEHVDVSLFTAATMDAARGVAEVLADIESKIWDAVKVCLGAYFFYRRMGPACLVFLVCTLVLAVLIPPSGNNIAKWTRIYKERRQTRIDSTKSIISQIKTIKMMGLGSCLSGYIQAQHTQEMTALLSAHTARSTSFIISTLAYCFPPAATLGVQAFLIRHPDPLTATEVFVYFIIANLLCTAAAQCVNIRYIAFFENPDVDKLQQYLLLGELPAWRNPEVPPDDTTTPRVDSSNRFAIEIKELSVLLNNNELILSDVYIAIPRGSIVVVLGPVACGKTTLLRVILGEVIATSGTITLSSTAAAYSAQEMWLQDLAIRSIIVSHYEFVRPWYNAVVRACALDTDFARLPDKDLTMAGSNGCNLTSSQKQRIALARTFYSRSPIIILDDVLQNVDHDTSATVLHRLFGIEGLVRQWNPAVIMTTCIFEHLAFADTAIEIDEAGKVNQHQNSTDFMSLPRVALQFRTASTALDERTLPVDDPENFESLEDVERRPCNSQNKYAETMELYAYWQQSVGWVSAAVFLVSVAIAGPLERMPEVFLRIVLRNEAFSVSHFLWYILIATTNAIWNKISADLYFRNFSAASAEVLHWRSAQTLIRATPAFLASANLHSILKIFSQDLPSVASTINGPFINACFFFLRSIFDVAILSTTSTYAFFLVPIYILIFRHILSVYIPYERQLNLLGQQSDSSMSAHAAETVDGLEHIRAARRQNEFRKQLFYLLDKSSHLRYHISNASRRLYLILDLLVSLSLGYIVVHAQLFPSSSSEAALGLSFVIALNLSLHISLFVRHLLAFMEPLQAIDRIETFCSKTPLELDPVGDETLSDAWPVVGEISLHDASTTSSGYDAIAAHNLENATVFIEHATKVGLGGPPGQGQPTMILAVLRMVDYSGSIRLDGREIKTVPHDILRSRITTITHEGLELSGSIRLNLDPLSIMDDYFSNDDLISMLTRVGLWSVVQRRGGLDAKASTMRFSKGQKQLLGLARAALHRRRTQTKLVLIDEATCNLDAQTDLRMQDFMDGEFAACTVITVSQNLSAYETADVVLVMEAGGIKCVLELDEDSDQWTARY